MALGGTVNYLGVSQKGGGPRDPEGYRGIRDYIETPQGII